MSYSTRITRKIRTYEAIIKQHLKPKFIKHPDGGMGPAFGSYRCPICKASVAAIGKPGMYGELEEHELEPREPIQHKVDCFWNEHECPTKNTL